MDGKLTVVDTLTPEEAIKTYLVEDPETREKYVKKEFANGGLTDLEGWMQEMRILKSLEHPAIPRIIEYADNYFLTEHKEGSSLRQLLDEGKFFSRDEAIHIAEQVLDALDYVHNQYRIVHKDINPNNILYDEDSGEVSLVDFGLSGVNNNKTTTSRAGTYPYMAPERFRGKSNFSSDIYGLGATLVELLTRSTLDEFTSGDSIFEMQTSLPQDLDPKISSVLAKMVEADSRKRYQNVKQVIADLRHEQSSEEIVPASSDTVTQLFAEILRLRDELFEKKYLLKELEEKSKRLFAKLGFRFAETRTFRTHRSYVSNSVRDIFFREQGEGLDILVVSENYAFPTYCRLLDATKYGDFMFDMEEYVNRHGYNTYSRIQTEHSSIAYAFSKNLRSKFYQLGNSQDGKATYTKLSVLSIISGAIVAGTSASYDSEIGIALGAGVGLGGLIASLLRRRTRSRQAEEAKKELEEICSDEEKFWDHMPFEFFFDGHESLDKLQEEYYGTLEAKQPAALPEHTPGEVDLKGIDLEEGNVDSKEIDLDEDALCDRMDTVVKS